MNLHAVNLLVEGMKRVAGMSAAVATTSTTVPRYISMKGYRKCAIVLDILNGTTVTGSAITVQQATAVAGTSAKALAFTKMHSNIDTATLDLLAVQTVAANTFTTDTTNAKNLMYVIDVDASQLDRAGGFDCLRVACATSVNTLTFVVTYHLYGALYLPAPTAITD